MQVRLAQLLRAFPGHAVLLAVGQVADRILQLDVMEVSIGKCLVGLEVVLRKAQEWEEHASKRVMIGDIIVHIWRLVAN